MSVICRSYNKYLDADSSFGRWSQEGQMGVWSVNKERRKNKKVYYWVGYHGGHLGSNLAEGPLQSHSEFSSDWSHQVTRNLGLYPPISILPWLRATLGIPRLPHMQIEKLLKCQERSLRQKSREVQGLQLSCWQFMGDSPTKLTGEISASAAQVNVFHHYNLFPSKESTLSGKFYLT